MDAARTARRTPLAKLTRPRARNLVQRTRLFRTLDRAADARVLWVSAPAGAGKTSLLASYIEARQRTAIWYQLDAADSELATFFHYLTLTVPRMRPPLPVLTAEYLQFIDDYTRRYLRRYFARVRRPTVLVFDNYHEVEEHSALHHVMNQLIAEAPEGVQIVFASRHAPPHAFARWQSDTSMVVLDADDLRLELRETAQLIPEGRRVQRADLKRVHELTRGWAAGIVLMLRSGSHELHDLLATDQLHQTTFDYFAAEMFGRLPATLQQFLLRTALLPTMTAQDAQSLSGNPDAAAILTDLQRRNYFIASRRMKVNVYEYHPLFRSFLLDTARETIPRAALEALRAHAATALEAGAQFEAAADLWLETKSWDALARLSIERAELLIGQGRHALLARWLLALPSAQRDGNAVVQYWLGVAQMPQDPTAARICLERAYASFAASDDPASALRACAGILDSYLFAFDDFNAIDHWGNVLHMLLERDGACPTAIDEARALTSAMVLAYRPQRHVPLLEHAMERAQQLIQDGIAPQLQLALVTLIGWVAVLRGEGAGLVHSFDRIEAIAASNDVAPLQRITWMTMLAAITHQRGGYEASMGHVLRTMSIADDAGVHVLDPMIASHLAYTALHLNDWARVEQALSTMRARVAPSHRLDVAHLTYMEGLIRIAKGDARGARRFATESVEATATCGAEAAEAQSRILLALTLIELGDIDGAFAEANHLLTYGMAAAQRNHEHAGYLLRAHCLLARGETREALSALAAGLALGREYEYRTLFPWSPAHFLAPLCAAALRAGIEREYVRTLIRELDLKAPDGEIEDWPWQVRIYTLGRFALTVNDVPTNIAGKAQRKPLEMLKYLIAQGGRDVDASVLAQTLWLDVDGGAAQKSFEITLHRLRKLLGGDETIELRNGRMTLDSTRCWVDAWATERALGRLLPRLRALRGRNEALDFGDDLEQLLARYQGALFASDGDAAWLHGKRERIRQRFVQCVTAIADHWRSTGHVDRATDLYQRGIAVDNLAEALYRGLMASHIQRGEHAEAMNVYRRCRDMLSIVLGMKPSASTERVRQSIGAMGACDN